MKTKIIISTILATFLIGTTLNANTLYDSVANKETNAINNAKVKGEAAAQAKIEEVNSKEEFLAKQKRHNFSQDSKADKAKQIRKNVNKELTNHTPKANKAPKEVLNGFDAVIMAMHALDENNVKAAKASLQKATTFFSKALKDDPSLNLVPISDDVKVNTFEGDSKLVEQLVTTAKKLLENYDTQAARAILLPLKDEMRVSTEYLPMKLYPAAIQQAQSALEKGNKDLSISILMNAFDTIVVDTVTVPIAVLTAQDLINVAAKLNKAKKKEAQHLLGIANDELKKAVLLGYVKKYQDEYKLLNQEIQELQKEIQGENKVEKLYDNLKTHIDSLIGKIRKDIKRAN